MKASRKIIFCSQYLSTNDIVCIKKWLAHAEGFCKGEIHVNQGLEDQLNGTKAVSILPIGVTKIVGDFEEDDIVKIINSREEEIGIGKVATDNKNCQRIIGLPQQKPIIHYDYLYINDRL